MPIDGERGLLGKNVPKQPSSSIKEENQTLQGEKRKFKSSKLRKG